MLLLGMQTLENRENAVEESRLNPDAIIADGEYPLPDSLSGSDAYGLSVDQNFMRIRGISSYTYSTLAMTVNGTPSSVSVAVTSAASTRPRLTVVV